MAIKKSTKTYYTHDNGLRPFKVNIIDNKTVRIYPIKYLIDKTNKSIYSDQFFEIVFPMKIFIGKGIKGDLAEDGNGKRYPSKFSLGNSILISTGENVYIYIGSSIYYFRTKYPIIKYASPIGYSDIIFPVAIDSECNFYLLEEKAFFPYDDYVSITGYDDGDYLVKHCDKNARVVLDLIYGTFYDNIPYKDRYELDIVEVVHDRILNWDVI